MAEEASNSMNLDLNLGPSPDVGSETMPSDTVNFVDWVAVDPIDRIVEAVRLRPRQRRRWRQVEYPHDQPTLSVELDQLISSSGNVDVLQSGEGSVTAGERAHEVPKTCENNNGSIKDQVSEKKGDVEKGSGEDGSFFDCNICFELATDPVVTCCGHLFCWPCLYRWLHAQEQEGRECPVCKGEVSTKNLTPIYGRGNSNQKPVDSSSLEIPVRPHARRVESLRQAIHRNLFSFPVEEVIRRLSSRFDLIEDLSASHDGANGTHVTADRTSSLLQRNTARSLPTPLTPPDDALDLTESGTTSYVRRQARRLQSLLIRRPQSQYHQSPSRTSFPPLFSTERLSVYSRRNSTSLSQEQPQPVDDRDSFSSVAAVINSESQMDTAMEIDSMVSLSTSSSRRRIDASRSSDVDSGDSPPRRRRRLN